MKTTRSQKYYKESQKRRDYCKIYNNSSIAKESFKRYYNKLKMSVFALLGMECVRCGFDDLRALQIDHINGGGAKEIKSFTRNKYKVLHEKILNGSKEYQVLCANCNWIKRSENNENRKSK